MPITNSLNLPKPFVDAVSTQYAYKPKRYSVTSVLKGTREAILQRRHQDEITQDVADMVWLIFGTAVHSVLENSKETSSQLKEQWVTAEMPNGYTLSGIFDLYDDATGTVTDYKTASVYKVMFDEWDDYRKQLLCYCWILRKMGFDAKRGEIVALLKDHSKSKAERERDYPKHPVFVKAFDFTERDFEEIDALLAAKFEEIERSEALPDDELPPCTADERWHSGDRYAVMKKGRKTAVKLYDTAQDADKRADEENDATTGNPYYVEYRPGCSRKCRDYCTVAAFCSQWKEEEGN